MFDAAQERFGTAKFADEATIQKAGLFTYAPDALFIGFFDTRRGQRALWYHLPAGVLMTAGARGGKGAGVLGFNVCAGILRTESLILLDPKAEMASYSRNQCADRKHCLYFNPSGLFGFPQDRFNALDQFTRESKTLHADLKALALNLIATSGSAQAIFFEDRAREFLEAICLILVLMDGVLTFPRLYWALSLIPAGGDEWLDLAFEMSEGPPLCQRVEAEIAEGRDNPTGGHAGVIAQLLSCVACLSDDNLMACVSPPFTASLADLTKSDRCYQVYLMPEVEHLTAMAPILKALFLNAATHRARSPSAPRQTWILDELAQLNAFPLATQLYSVGAGRGIRVLGVYQSHSQLKRTAPHAEQEIPASAALRIAFATRDYPTAKMISDMCGVQTLRYEDEPARATARAARHKAAQSLLAGADPAQAAQELALHSQLARHEVKQHRALLTPDEILTLPSDKMLVFHDGLPGPILATRKSYWTVPEMAGRYLDTPYHPPMGHVAIQGRWGPRKARVVSGAVPTRYRDYPQYHESDTWSYVEGYRP